MIGWANGATRRAVGLASLVVAALIVGCPAVATPVARPVARLLAVAVAPGTGADATDERAEPSTRLRLRLSLYNPNAIAMTARALDWHVGIADADPLRGRTALDVALPAGARTTATIDIDLPVAVASGSQSYRLAGTLHLFSERGDVGVVIDSIGTATAAGAL